MRTTLDIGWLFDYVLPMATSPISQSANFSFAIYWGGRKHWILPRSVHVLNLWNFRLTVYCVVCFSLALSPPSLESTPSLSPRHSLAPPNLTRQSEMADLARRATSVCTKFHRDRLRNDWIMTSDTHTVTAKNGIYRNFIWGVRTSTPVDLGNYNA